MHKTEARGILAAQIDRLKTLPYGELTRYTDPELVESFEVVGESGTRFEVEIGACWEDEAQHNLRVIVEVDDFGEDKLLPVTETFVVSRSA